MRNNIDNCFEPCESTGIRCLEGDEALTTSKIVTNSVGVFFDFLLDNADKESDGSNERIESPSQWFIRGWRENYDEIIADMRAREKTKLYKECFNTLKQKVTLVATNSSPTERAHRKKKPIRTGYDELQLPSDGYDNVNSNKNNNSNNCDIAPNDVDTQNSGNKDRKKKGRRGKSGKKEKKKTHELPNSLNGIQFYTGNVLPRIRQHDGPADEEEEDAIEVQCYTQFDDTADMADNTEQLRMIKSMHHKEIVHEIHEVGKTEEQKFFENDKRILASVLKNINQKSGTKFRPLVLTDEVPAAVKITKERDIDVVKLRGQFSQSSMLPQIGQTNPKDNIGKIMKIEEHTMEIKEKKNLYSKDFLINMERLRKERVKEEINKIEHQLQCSNPHGDGNMENMPTFAPQPPKGKPNAPRRGRRFKPSSQIPDENLLYVPHVPEHDEDM